MNGRNGNIAVKDVVIDPDVYPRAEVSDQTVERYVEALKAGERFPPIILERGSNRLLDGMHRYRAHQHADLTGIDATHHELPNGVPPKLYAASLSARHGDRIARADLKEVARDTVRESPNFSMQTVARMLGITRQTMGRWVGDITERRKEVRRVRAMLLSRLGWTQEEIGAFLDVSQQTITNNVNVNIPGSLTEDLLREALELEAFEDENGEIAEVANELREELIFSKWSQEERGLLDRIRAGETVVVNMHGGAHPNLAAWAAGEGLFIKIDRRSVWGNPFEVPDDGDRNTVVRNYEKHYLPHKPSLQRRRDELAGGKVLGCWCAPKPCHGDILKAWAETGR